MFLSFFPLVLCSMFVSMSLLHSSLVSDDVLKEVADMQHRVAAAEKKIIYMAEENAWLKKIIECLFLAQFL